MADMSFADLQPRLEPFRNAQKIWLTGSNVYYPARNFIELEEVAKMPKKTVSTEFVRRLNKCFKGKGAWREFENLIKEVFTYLFVPPLVEPFEQSRTETGLHIRDLIFDIPYALSGFWGYIRDKFDSSAIIVECKNYSSPIEGNEIIIPSKYLGKHKLGRFGIVVSRMKPNPSAIKERKRLWIEDKKLIMNLRDDHLVRMLELKEKGKEPEILLDKLIHDFFRNLE
jgi:hypothetical protein